MSVTVNVTRLYSETLEVKKVEVLAKNQFRVKYDNAGTELVVKYDLSTLEHLVLQLRGSHDGVLDRFDNTPVPVVWFAVWGSGTYSRETRREEISVTSYPHYAFLASGETETAETETATYTPVALTNRQKLDQFRLAYQDVWEPQVEAWLQAAVRYIGLSFDILKRGGLMLKAASWTIHQMALDTATFDRGDLARLTELMAAGALDVTTAAEFAVYLNGLGQYFPDGPVKPRTAHGIPEPGATHIPVGVLWVDEDAEGNLVRVNSNAVVFYDSYEVPSGYNPHDVSWLDTLTLPPLATPGNLTLTPGDTEIVASWDAVTNAEGYRVYVRQGNTGSYGNPVTRSDNMALSETLTGLTNSQVYSVRVSAYADDENDYADSDAVSDTATPTP